MIEPNGDVARELEVLFLVLPDRHHVGVVEQDVGGHQHRVVEGSGIWRLSSGERVFVGMSAFELTCREEAAQHPGELEDFRNRRLAIEERAFRIQSTSEPGSGDIEDVTAEGDWVADRRQRVIVGDEVERSKALDQRKRRPDRSEIVSKVRSVGGLDPSQRRLHDARRMSHVHMPGNKGMVGSCGE